MPWYDKKWVIILFLVILWPVGLLMMWRAPTFSTKTKGLVTVFFVLIFFAAGSNKTPTKTTTQSPPAATTTEQTNKSLADEAKVKETIQAVTPAKSETPAPPPAPAKVLNLGMTFEQFKAAYKSNSLAITGQEFNIDNDQLQIRAAQDVFQSKIS